MPDKLTQEQADKLDMDVGAIPIGKYVNDKTKREYKCPDCGVVFLRTSYSTKRHKCVWCKSCGRIRQDKNRTYTTKEADDRERKLGALPIGPYIHNKIKREYECPQCHQHFYRTPNNVVGQKQTVCNKCSKINGANKNRTTVDKVKQQIIKLGFEPLFDEYINNRIPIKLRCHCGKMFYASLNGIKRKDNKKTSSCGQCFNPEIGFKSGKLTIVMVFESWNSGCQVVCECECGRDTELLFGSVIANGNTKSCGHCCLQRNGKFTSNTALQLHDIVEKITEKKWEHNFNIKGIGCIDIANPELKIAIEYDGYYWHRVFKDTSYKDDIKYQKLIQDGWKILIIKADGYELPTQTKLNKILKNDFQHSCKKKTITMNSWKKEQLKYLNKE